jgi:hypothetical protein
MQNFALAGNSVPQLEQNVPSDVPHSRQNFALPGFSCWQREHFMVDPCLCLIIRRSAEPIRLHDSSNYHTTEMMPGRKGPARELST